MNVKSFKLSEFKSKESIAPYTKPNDERFKVCIVHVYAHVHVKLLNLKVTIDIFITAIYFGDPITFVFAVVC